MINFSAFSDCLRIARWGEDMLSRTCLLVISLLQMMEAGRRKHLREGLHRFLEACATQGVLTLHLSVSGHGTIPINLRMCNADHQTVVECLGDMYPVPSTPIRYLFDGGANLGLFSIAALGRLRKVEEIIVAEPNPSNLSLLKRNLTLIGDVTTLPVALAEFEGSADFTASAQPNKGELIPESNGARRGNVEVECRRITSVIPEHWDMDHTWLKLDIEGAEYGVLDDLLRSSLRPAVITAELHDYLNRDGQDVVNALDREGYDITVEGKGNSGYVCRQIIAERRV